MSVSSLLFFARVLLVAWAGWWTYFVLASAFAPPVEPSKIWQCFVALGVGILVFAGSALVALRWQRFGGVLLIVEGIVMTILHFTFYRNPLPTQLFLVGTMALPPLIVGVILTVLSPSPHPRLI